MTMVEQERILVRLGEARARGRLTDALTGIALDVVYPYASEYLPAGAYRDLVGLLEPVSGKVATAALAMLADELDRLLASDGSDLFVALQVVQGRGPWR
jgi:hypothetical protein